MQYVHKKARASIESFKLTLSESVKQNGKKYSNQRLLLLEVLHKQSHPISIKTIVALLNAGENETISYATATRHINFFKKIGWLIVASKTYKRYLLVRHPDINLDEYLSI